MAEREDVIDKAIRFLATHAGKFADGKQVMIALQRKFPDMTNGEAVRAIAAVNEVVTSELDAKFKTMNRHTRRRMARMAVKGAPR